VPPSSMFPCWQLSFAPISPREQNQDSWPNRTATAAGILEPNLRPKLECLWWFWDSTWFNYINVHECSSPQFRGWAGICANLTWSAPESSKPSKAGLFWCSNWCPIRIRKGQVVTVAADLKCHKGAFCHKYALLHSLVDFKKGSCPSDGAMETA